MFWKSYQCSDCEAQSVILHEAGHWYPWAMLYKDVRWGWGLRMSAEMIKLHKLVELQYMTIFIPSQPIIEPKPNA